GKRWLRFASLPQSKTLARKGCDLEEWRAAGFGVRAAEPPLLASSRGGGEGVSRAREPALSGRGFCRWRAFGLAGRAGKRWLRFTSLAQREGKTGEGGDLEEWRAAGIGVRAVEPPVFASATGGGNGVSPVQDAAP